VKILLIEDDRQTADYIAKGLRQHGHVVDQVDNGRDGLYMATGEPYDVMVVDRHLPKMDGLSMVKAARDAGMRTPALFLTTMGGVDDRVAGLEAGADDYLVKPFAFAELLARISALAGLAAARSSRGGRTPTSGTLFMPHLRSEPEQATQARIRRPARSIPRGPRRAPPSGRRPPTRPAA